MLHVSMIRLAAALALLASAAAASPLADASPSADLEGRPATFLVPDVGIFYVRYGEPGAVRILSGPGEAAGDSIGAGWEAALRVLDREEIARIFREEYARARGFRTHAGVWELPEDRGVRGVSPRASPGQATVVTMPGAPPAAPPGGTRSWSSPR